MDRIPIITVAGYLGAGKTSCLNHVLTLPHMADQHVALIINEFGSINVDGSLISEDHHAKYELNKGSVFCVCIKTEFLSVLDSIANDIQPDLVIIEATGIAKPCDLDDVMDAKPLRDHFTTQANLCVVDTQNFTKVAPYMKTAQDQVRWADGIVLNKMDLVSENTADRVATALRKINPDAPQQRASHGKITGEFLDDVEHTPWHPEPDQNPPENIVAVTIPADRPYDREDFRQCLTQLGDHLLRAKGTVDFGSGPVLIQSVFQDVTEEKPPEKGSSSSGFVVITQGLQTEEVKERFAELGR